jgi:predicted dithiol-disulfide oxidoreductase (DUF899 family)
MKAIKKSATLIGRTGRHRHAVVSAGEWTKARIRLLKAEKKVTRMKDELARRRRALPWVRVDKDYVFEGPKGKVSLGDLFAGKRQLFMYHFMFGPQDRLGCPICSFWADHFDGPGKHLGQRDTAFAAVSLAPWRKLKAFKRRMGWGFNWVSSAGSDFNFDYGVSRSPAEKNKPVYYNYGTASLPPELTQFPGASVFYRDADGSIYRTYAMYARGIEPLNLTYWILDQTPKGRDEDPDWPVGWVDYHDRYKGK